MYLNGKGEDMFNDIMDYLLGELVDTQLGDRYGTHLLEVIDNNFSVDFFKALRLSEEEKTKALKDLNRRISLFCSAFII